MKTSNYSENTLIEIFKHQEPYDARLMFPG